MTHIEEIEDRLASITPQPWEEAGIQLTEGAEMVHGICAFRGDSECIVCHSDQNSEEPHQDSADMYFIARAPADITYLLSEVKRMREALNQIDAIVPSISHLPACSAPALRGILERIGGLITAALEGTQS